MRHIPTIAGILLGLLFLAASIPFLLKMPMPAPTWEKGSPPDLFMGAFVPTHYLTFIKVLELIGGLLVMVPRTRNLGLLVLGPIIVNILAFSVFLTAPKDLLNPMLIGIVLLALYLMWVERKAWAGLVRR